MLVRNPHFKEWSRRRAARRLPRRDHVRLRPDRRGRRSPQIENGQADWMFDPPPADRLNEIGTKYAKQVHVNTPLTAIWYLPMNVNLAPFNNKLGAPGGQLRDRPQRGRAHLRRPEARLAGLPGAARRLPGHASTTARTPRTRARSGRRPTSTRPSSSSRQSGTARPEGRDRSSQDDEVNKAIGVYLQSVLNRSATRPVKPISGNIQFTYIQNTNNKVQICSPSGTRTIRRRRTSSTCCSAARRSTPAATPASTSPASATRRSTPRCRRR